jgi:hypothetical protein
MQERGQTMPFLLLLVALAAVTALAVVQVGVRAVDAARARTAADAAALAGAAGGEAAAREVAAANGAALLHFGAEGSDTEVTVSAGAAEATARARLEGGGAASTTTGLDPRMVAAINRAEALLGERVPVTSGWRSRADQQRLWDQRHQNPYPVARPGTSRHERGLAIDVARGFVARLRSVAAAAGLCFPLPVTDPVHFEVCPGPGR